MRKLLELGTLKQSVASSHLLVFFSFDKANHSALQSMVTVSLIITTKQSKQVRNMQDGHPQPSVYLSTTI